MKFTLISLFALVSVALAVTPEEHNEFAKRQSSSASTVPANDAAMTDKDGNVVAFDTANVYLAAAAEGI